MMKQQEVPSKQGRMEKWTLSPEISQLAEMARLGRFTVCYTFMDYTIRESVIAMFLMVLSALFFSVSFFLTLYAIGTGVMLLMISLMAFGVTPLLVLAYLIGKRALKAGDGDLATAYFYQQGFVYLHEEQRIVLRWEQIERVDMTYGPVRRCQIALADGETILLINGGRGGLSQEIRRRVIRARKKHQHHEK